MNSSAVIMTDNNNPLPKAPKELCFSELCFIQDDFDVDVFLQEHRKNVKLETMCDHLGMYMNLLRSAMIDLINRDCNDFVNLSSNLIGLDDAINNLQAPLGQLREEVMQVRQVLDDEITAISSCLNEMLQNREYKQSLHSLQRIYKSLRKLSSILSMDRFMDSPVKADVLEQAAAEMNQLKFHVSRCKLDIKPQVDETDQLETLLVMRLNELFLACIHEKNSILLVRCLRIYMTLDKVAEAESVVKNEVVRRLVDGIITDGNLQADTLSIQSVYHRLVSILNLELKQVLDITLNRSRVSVKGFNFLVNSFWVEAEEKIEQYMKAIFAPGDPELFHKRYTETLEFLAMIEAECTPECLASFRSHPQYKRFLKKWNLPVYFQIRFQEIAGAVEVTLAESISPASIKGKAEILTEDQYCLHATCVVWDNLLKIWADDVYIYQLFQRLWRLSLQICSRYRIWIQQAVKQAWPTVNETNSNEQDNFTKLNFLVYLYIDVDKFIKRLPSFLSMTQSKLRNKKDTLPKLLEDCLAETSDSLKNALPLITEEIVSELLAQCVTHLKQVSDIPRLFRRTNREVPTKACVYVKNALSSLNTFHNSYNKLIPVHVNQWLELALSSLTERYLTFVLDVLTSVQKTEESLRRLKKIRDKSTGTFSSEAQGVSDDEKIRIQLQVDVRGYNNMIKELNISTDNIKNLQELLQAVESAVKK